MIAVIDYGRGNLHSVKKAFEYLGQDCIVTSSKESIASAHRVVLPGVGAFGDAMEALEEKHLIDPVKGAIASGKPFLGICLGMQLLFAESLEYGHCQGLGVIPGRVVPFAVDEKIPHMGFNSLMVKKKGSILSDNSFVYFVHSFHATDVREEDILSLTHYGYDFVSAIQHDNVYGCQFHPEKSGETGLNILKRFCEL